MFTIMLIVFFFAVTYAGGDPYDLHATILKFESNSPEETYNFEYATSNNIQVAEKGFGDSYAVGSYAYDSPDGQPIQLQYTADENGYWPQDAHLPMPPPIPHYILKALMYIEDHPYQKILFP